MTTPLLHGAVCLAVGLPWLVALPCSAQASRSNDVSATVANTGAVLAVSPLTVGNRESSGNLTLTGTVTTRQNGPYELRVRLTAPFTEAPSGGRGRGGGGTPVVNEVQTLLPGGSYATLGTANWVTIATGPGAASSVNPVQFLVVWGQGSSKNPQLATTIPVEYQVGPP